MNVHTICTGSFRLPLPVEDALALFTPEGERPWAGADWDPVYAVPEAAKDDSAPGTVFTTESTGGAATWIVLERRADGMSYARVVPGTIAGTIGVTCRAVDSGETHVTVTYDSTSLSAEGTAFLQELESDYDAFLDSWREEIVKALALAP
jgi:hypothetical protein